MGKNYNSVFLCDYCKKEFNTLEEAKKHEVKCKTENTEKKMNELGYFKGEMCPFSQVQIGGTKNVASSVLFGAPSYDEFTWTHCQCMKEYCALWNEKNNCCSMKLITRK